MADPKNLVTADKITQKPDEAPKELSPAQVEALDRDGDGKAGGSLPKVGEVTKKGSAPPDLQNRKPNEICIVRITKAGHGQVHDGAGGVYDWNDEVPLPYSVGKALEGRAYGEIVG
jgi:hypothetical protein